MKKYLTQYQKYHIDGFKKITNQKMVTEENKGLTRTLEGHDAMFLSRTEYLVGCERTFTQFIENKDIETQIILYTKLFPNPYTLGLYEAFEKQEMSHLLNVLYQTSRHSAINLGGGASGYDHCINFFGVINAFAANDTTLVNALLPKGLGESKNGHKFMVLGTNLMFSIWHKDVALLEKTKLVAVRYLSGKRTLLEKAILDYLIALAEIDTDAISVNLKNVCLATRKNQGESKLSKLFCRNAHGLYHFAHFVLPDEIFKKIELPNDEGFIEEYAQWNMENDFPQGTLFLNYPDEMALMNVILNVDVPDTSLNSSPNGPRNTLYTDVDEFKKGLIQRILCMRG